MPFAFFLSICTVVGFLVLLKFFLNLIWEVTKELIPTSQHLLKYGQNEGKWAVVTGGTDGIGLGFCEELSALGWNTCIISRNQ
jgi:hypothetical protein